MKRKAIAHYKRMIKWAKTQNPRARADIVKMSYELKDCWSSDECVYCEEYIFCGECPLASPNWEIEGCCGGLWDKMDDARTWKTWIKYAEQVLEYIKENG